MSSKINGIINDIIQQFRPQTVLVLGRDDVDLISVLNKQDINAYGFLANDAKREDIPEELLRP